MIKISIIMTHGAVEKVIIINRKGHKVIFA